MWIISFMIMLAIDITEITGLKPIFYYNLTNENFRSLKSQQFNRFLSSMGFPGSSCLLIILWSQKLMSFDRLLLAVIWTLGILSCNQTDDKDIKYIARQIEKKKAWMYYSERISVSPLK
uniref:Nuclear envelope membrane protein n=2 Tax=Schizaphis graminum TaxID=13262 RepID=A0A2S2N9A8_SCHGA